DRAGAPAADPLGAIDDAAVVIDGALIADAGPRAEILPRHAEGARVVDHEGVVTPGLVDAHTHAPWVGSRDGEYALRMAGAGYEAIAKGGGGIVASMRALRAASGGAIAAAVKARAPRLVGDRGPAAEAATD